MYDYYNQKLTEPTQKAFFSSYSIVLVEKLDNLNFSMLDQSLLVAIGKFSIVFSTVPTLRSL